MTRVAYALSMHVTLYLLVAAAHDGELPLWRLGPCRLQDFDELADLVPITLVGTRAVGRVPHLRWCDENRHGQRERERESERARERERDGPSPTV